MSWKLAEWRWREQAPLRERFLWKIWDVEDIVKSGDVVEEVVRLAYNFPDQVDGCWQSRIQRSRGGRLGSIRSGTNPYPPPQSQLPDLPPQQYTSYHPSRSSSAPLLASIEKPAPTLGDLSSLPSISVLLSNSTNSIPTLDASPRTPQIATDFLDTRDWNHLALDQEVDSKIAATQLRSSFGLFSKAFQHSNSPRRGTTYPQYCRLATASTSADPRVHSSPDDWSRLHRRDSSVQDVDPSCRSLQDRVVPFSHLDTVFEHQQYFVRYCFQHEGAIFEVLNPHESFGEQLAVSAEISLEEPSHFQHSSHDSASLLLPDRDMPRFTTGKSENDASIRSKAKRNDTPPAKVFDDLPTAHSEILGQSGELSKIPPVQEMKTTTGKFANLPPLIDLPRTPARPGPASPALQQKLAEAKALRERRQPLIALERPITSLLPEDSSPRFRRQAPQGGSCRQGQFEDDDCPAGDFVIGDDQIKQLRRIASNESMLTSKVIVRNSRSFFDLNREHRRGEEEHTERFGLQEQERIISVATGTTDSVIDMYSGMRPRRSSHVLVRDSCDIMGIAISGDKNYSRHAEGNRHPEVPAALRISLHGAVPQTAPLPVPVGARRHQYQQNDFASSEVAEYDNTKSLLTAVRYDPHADMAEDFQTQALRSTKEAENGVLQNNRGNLANSALQGVRGQKLYDTDDFGHNLTRCGPREPEYYLSGFSQLTADSEDIGMSVTAPYHGALKAINDAVSYNNSRIGSPGHDSRGSREFAERDLKSSYLSKDEGLSRIIAINNPGGRQDSEGIVVQGDSFQRNVGSAEWFANGAKKDFNKHQNRKDGEETDNDYDWETIHGSGHSILLSPAALQPLFEPLPVLRFKTDLRTDPSLANISSDTSSFGSVSTGQGQSATPWDPIPKLPIRTHPALLGTPHKYRLRKDASTGEEVFIPEYSLPEVGQHSSSADPFESTQATPDLPAGYPFPVSKFSASTPRQQALGDDTSSKQYYSSSPPVILRRRREARMAAVGAEQDLAQARTVHEIEGDQSYNIGIAVSTDVAEDNKQDLSQTESVYSLASDEIIQDEPLVIGANIERPANIPGTRATPNNDSSDEISIREGMQYGEQAYGIEMKKMRLDRNFSIGTLCSASSGSGYLQNSSSQASIPFQSRLMSQGRDESNEDLLKRLSTIQDDGSYGEDDDEEDVVSLSTFMRENNPLTPRTGTSNKRGILGANHNLTGTARESGMRAIGSSPKNISSDVYDPAKQRNHHYGQLSSGPESGHEVGNEGNTNDITKKTTNPNIEPREGLTREQVQEGLSNKGLDVKKIAWGNVQKDITGVTFPMGQAISAPRPLVLPRTVPPTNSFVLTKEQPLRMETTTDEILKERIEMAMDDWYRLNQPCPVFPLRDSHLTMKFTESDPRRTGDNVYNRGGISRINGRIEEDAFCFNHNRREFSTLPALRKTPLSPELMRIRKEAGREIVWMCLCIPIVGWVLLYYLWKDEPGLRVDGELMRWKTKGIIQEIGEEEIEFAGRVLLWFGLGLVGVALACLAVLLWAFL